MKTKQKSPKVGKIKDTFKVLVKVLGKTYEQNGDSVAEALNKFDIRNVKGVRGILIVEHNGARKERILMPMQTTRLFNSHGLMKEVNIKNVSLMFQGL